AHEYWPAEISFSSAFSLWQGTFVPGNFGSDAAIEYQDELEQLFLETSLSFARLLAETKRFQQAGKLLRDALRYDPTNDRLIKLMHRLYLAEGSPRKASQVLNNYREALHREDYSAREVDEVLQDFKGDLPIESWLESN
ncbi:MAG: tetratricopeptide repeat protein, partial [Gammaproteobacteria bacterium]|nr:tetratricopeptide repeat protein [Gammaproteobacteria bacterium]